MNTTAVNDTEMAEMLQTLMNEGMQGFPAVMARMYNLDMQFERELHLGAGKYERTEDRTGYANGYKPKTVQTAAGKLRLQIPQVRDSERPFYPKSLDNDYMKLPVRCFSSRSCGPPRPPIAGIKGRPQSCSRQALRSLNQSTKGSVQMDAHQSWLWFSNFSGSS